MGNFNPSGKGVRKIYGWGTPQGERNPILNQTKALLNNANTKVSEYIQSTSITNKPTDGRIVSFNNLITRGNIYFLQPAHGPVTVVSDVERVNKSAVPTNNLGLASSSWIPSTSGITTFQVNYLNENQLNDCCFYIEIAEVPNVRLSHGIINRNDDFASYKDSTVPTPSLRASSSTFGELVNPSDYLIVQGVDFYYRNGTATTRTTVGSSNSYCPFLEFEFESYVRLNGDGTYETVNESGHLFKNLYAVLGSYKNTSTAASNKLLTVGQPETWFIPLTSGLDDSILYLGSPSYFPLGETYTTYPSTAAETTLPRVSTVIRKDKFAEYLNLIGIPWTTSRAEAYSANISDFTTGYDPNVVIPSDAGQPDDVTGGGDGDGDNTSDEFEPSNGYNPLYPTAKQWVMSGHEVDVFQSYLWFPSVWQQIQELWGDAWGAIISLKYYPFNIIGHDAANVAQSETIQIGNIRLETINPAIPADFQPADATGSPLKTTYNCRIDLGEYEFKEYYGSFMDYEPYTSISIFLPFIGWRDIGTTEVMGNKLKVHYIIDFNTGGCTAYLTINNGTNEFLYSSYQGTIAIDLPLQQSDYMDKVRNMGISLLSTALGAMVQQNGISSSTSSLSQSSSNTTGISDVVTNSANKRIGGSAIVGSGRTISLNNAHNQSQSYINANRSSSNETLTKSDPTLSVINGISGVAKMGVSPVHTTTSGTLGPTDSLWLSRKPIIRIERPIKSEASSFEENQGRPANITKKLADMTGYVECLNPVINFKCNESERAEIAALLQGGIYL